MMTSSMLKQSYAEYCTPGTDQKNDFKKIAYPEHPANSRGFYAAFTEFFKDCVVGNCLSNQTRHILNL